MKTVPENGNFIVCLIADDKIIPEGDGKSFRYAKEIADHYNSTRGGDWVVFEMVRPPDNKNQCAQCGYAWIQAKDKKSVYCPKCRSHCWDGDDKRMKYNFSILEVGESRTYHWPSKVHKGYQIKSALVAYSTRSGRKFHYEFLPTGLLVKRIA